MQPQLRFTCLCGDVNQVLEIKAPSLPVDSEFCHCTDDRYSTGSLGGCFVPLQSKPSSLDGLMAYHSSKNLSRYFCGTCGCQCFLQEHDHQPGEREWSACSGLVESEKMVTRITSHAFVEGTVDGGVAGRLRSIGGRRIECYAQGLGGNSEPMQNPPECPASHQSTPAAVSADDKLNARCHCGGVEFYITRPDLSLPRNGFWAQADGTKYEGIFCACRSCRLANGFVLQPWTYVPITSMFKMDGSPMKYDLETLRAYESSPDVFRYFCGRCGATVFFEQKSRAADLGFELINVSVGLLRAEEGARAEKWLEWRFADISFGEETVDKDLTDALAKSG